ncbi:MAG: outer membrane beta-barrel protein [Gemmatimonadaceae bacterium]
MAKGLSVYLSVAAFAAMATVAGAQTTAANPIELGVDAVIQSTIGETPNVTTVAIPEARFRVGFFVSNNLSIEPRVGITSVSGGGSTFTTYNGEVGLLYHFMTSERAGAGVYVRPFAGFTGVSGGGSDTQGDIGIGLGTKIPFADRLATRLEVNYLHGFSSNNNNNSGGNAIGASVGLSFFTR